MLTYNTHKKELIFPEYGRLVQQMADHALTLPDREERNRAALAIVNAMKAVSAASPSTQGESPEGTTDRRFWDHLAMMTGFALDIDWPFEMIRPDEIATKPEHVDYDGRFRNRFQYGRNLINMIDMAASMEPGDERNALIVLVANQMKKASLAWDEDGYTDEKIFQDLAHISEGRIVIPHGEIVLCEYIDAPSATKKKKKKK